MWIYIKRLIKSLVKKRGGNYSKIMKLWKPFRPALVKLITEKKIIKTGFELINRNLTFWYYPRHTAFRRSSNLSLSGGMSHLRKFYHNYMGSIPGRVIPKTQKMVLDASLLNTQHYKVRIKGKVEQSREGVAPSPTHWCSSYRKGSLRVTLDYGRQLYFTFTWDVSKVGDLSRGWPWGSLFNSY